MALEVTWSYDKFSICLKSKWKVVWKENVAVGQDHIIGFLLHWFTPSVHFIGIVRTIPYL